MTFVLYAQIVRFAEYKIAHDRRTINDNLNERKIENFVEKKIFFTNFEHAKYIVDHLYTNIK